LGLAKVYLKIIGMLVSDLVFDGQTESFEAAFAKGLQAGFFIFGRKKVERGLKNRFLIRQRRTKV